MTRKLLLVSVLLLAACGDGAKPTITNKAIQMVRVAGEIVDAKTGDPVEGAIVGSDDGRQGLSGPAGEFIFQITPGLRELTVAAQGYETAKHQIELREDGKLDPFKLTPRKKTGDEPNIDDPDYEDDDTTGGTVTPVTPTLYSVSPALASGGATVRLTGLGLGNSVAAASVSVGTVTAEISSWSDTTVDFLIPDSVAAGATAVQVVTNGKTTNALSITILPTILSVAPSNGSAGSPVIVTGKNFGPQRGASSILLGGHALNGAAWSTTMLAVTLPTTPTAGLQSLIVMVGGQSAIFDFTVDPVIESVTPSSGIVSESITLGGLHLGASQGSSNVAIGGMTAVVSGWTANSLTLIIPPGLTAGAQAIGVTVNGRPSNTRSIIIKPVLTSLGAATISGGGNLTLSGAGFGVTQGGSTVTVGDVASVVTSWSATSVVLTLSNTAPPGDQAVIVRVNGADTLPLLVSVKPALVELVPATGTAGSTLTIAGTNFGNTTGLVAFGAESAMVLTWSATSINAQLPWSSAPGTHTVTITAAGRLSNDLPFVVFATTNPSISSLSPDEGPSGTEVLIAGGNFGATQGSSYLTVGGITAEIVGWSAASITFRVPPGLSFGAKSVVATIGGIGSNPGSFLVTTIAGPTLASLLPASGAPATTVTLTGTGFGLSKGTSTVTVNGIAPTVSQWSNTAIVITIPLGLPAGSYPVEVSVDSQASNILSFVVLPPATPYITSVTPDTGPASTAVTLSGIHFGTGGDGSKVMLGGAQATILTWSDTSIVWQVPAGATAGRSELRVWANGIESNAIYFINGRPWIDQLYPLVVTTGTEISIYGRFFGANPATVTVAGASATIQGWTTNALQVQVPAAALTGRQTIIVTDANGQTSNSSYFFKRGSDEWMPTGELGPSRDYIPRAYHQAVWTGAEMIVWGGKNSTGFQSTGARFNPATGTWNAISLTNAPVGRVDFSMTWTGQEVLVWGGFNGTYLGDGKSYHPLTDTWSNVTALNAPLARHLHGAVWTGKELLVWGGFNGAYRGDGGRYDPALDEWTAISTGVFAPSGRMAHSTVWTGEAMVVWGGYNGGYLNTGGRYYPASDNWLATSMDLDTVPAARQDHVAIWTGDRMFLQGGVQSATLRDAHTYDPATDLWQKLANAPGYQGKSFAFWTGSRVLLSDPMNTLFQYDFATSSWSYSYFGTANYSGQSVVATGEELIAWGGVTTNGVYSSSGVRYDYLTGSVTAISDPLVLPPGHAYTSVWTGSQWFLYFHDNSANRAYRYDPAMDQWQLITVSNITNLSFSDPLVWTGGYVILYKPGSSSTMRYHPPTNSWPNGSAPVASAFATRTGHSVVWTGTEAIYWGGYNDSKGVRYNPVSDSWLSLSTVGAPQRRAGQSTVWTGSEMITWGGQGDGTLGTHVNGGRWNAATDTWSPLEDPKSGEPVSVDPFEVSRASWGSSGSWVTTSTSSYNGTYSFTDSAGNYNSNVNTFIYSMRFFIPTSTSTLDFAYKNVFGAGTVLNVEIYLLSGASSVVQTFGNQPTWTTASVPLGAFAGQIIRVYFRMIASTTVGDGTYIDDVNLTDTVYAHTQSYHSAVWTGDEMLVWGGNPLGSIVPGRSFSPLTNSWRTLSTLGEPSPRGRHATVWTGEEMLVWGGQYNNTAVGSGGRYDPVANVWRPLNLERAPSPRWDPVAAWTGTELLLYGGTQNGTAYLNTGGRYTP